MSTMQLPGQALPFIYGSKSYSNATIAASKATELNNQSKNYWYQEAICFSCRMYEESVAKFMVPLLWIKITRGPLPENNPNGLGNYEDAKALFDQHWSIPV